MELTKKQAEGLKIAVQRYKDKEPYTCISGYAGSGKSTLIKFIIDALEIENDKVAYVAYTGKAANVLKEKNCPNATTAHRLLYKAVPMPDGGFVFKQKPLDGYDLIVVDEVSMLPMKMWQLLLSHKVHILATGDPAQLPPINKDEDNMVLSEPHIFLDEIMRQAKESEIIRLSLHIRNGGTLDTFDNTKDEVMILRPSELSLDMLNWADQVLCAKNSTRAELNKLIREGKGFGDKPQPGDKVISLKNHWDLIMPNGNAITNGTMGTIKDYTVDSCYYPRPVSTKAVKVLWSHLTLEDGSDSLYLPMDYNLILNGNKTFSAKQEYILSRFKKRDPAHSPDLLDFVYGYAITCWKAQGSEWDKVLVFEENFPFDKSEHQSYLYTAVTRASKKVVLIKQ